MAVPGRPDDEWSAGCNALIRCNKAALVEKSEDIEYLLGWKPAALAAPVQTLLFTGMSDNEKKIWDALKADDSLSVDAIARMVEMPVFKLSPILLQMELAGMITPCPGNIYRIRMV